MESAASPLYLLESSDVGVVALDDERRVVSMNSFARTTLPVEERQPFERMVLSFHPERSQPKVKHLLDQASECPVDNPPPMTMIINIPERVLLIKVTRMAGASGQPTGYVLVFHDVTQVVSAQGRGAGPARAPIRLRKIPTAQGKVIDFVDVDAVLSIRSDGHYTRVVTRHGGRFCNLAIGELEARLDPERFMRVHRSHIANLGAVSQLYREDGRLMLRLRGDSAALPVSRTSQAELLARLGHPTVRQG